MSDIRTLVLTIVGTGVGLAVLLTGVMYALIGGVNTRIDDLDASLNTRIDDLRADVRGLDTRLRAVEVALGKVDQRLLTIERIVLPDAGD